MEPGNEDNEKKSRNLLTKIKNNNFAVRSVTTVVLIATLAVLIWMGRWPFAILCTGCVAVALYEELTIISKAGYHPVWWISFAGLAISIPIMMFTSSSAVIPLMAVLTFCALFCVMRRTEPLLMDILMTLLPLLSIVLPAVCIFGLISVPAVCLKNYLVVMMLGTSCGGDIAAYLAGSLIGGPKLCPVISPKKTISGSVGGLLGSLITCLIIMLCFNNSVSAETAMPSVWITLCCGLLAGMAGQIGDLFASMVKRCCGAKDFGHIFPGHGGMMDRMDSILFTAIIIYSYRILFFP